jgi:hypothetical protein
MISSGSKRDKRKKLGISFSHSWQIWKETNRRVFDNKEQSIPRLATLLQEEIALYSRIMMSVSA